MIKWILTFFALGLLVLGGSLYGAYRFLAVPFDPDETAAMLQIVEDRWAAQTKDGPSALSLMSQWQDDFEKNLAAKGQDAYLQSLQENPLLSRSALTAEDLAALKMFLPHAEPELARLGDFLASAPVYAKKGWLNPYDAGHTQGPDLVKVREAFRSSLVHAQIFALKGEWAALGRLWAAQAAFVKAWDVIPNALYASYGDSLKMELLQSSRLLRSRLPLEALEPLGWPAVRASLELLGKETRSLSDLTRYELYDFDTLTSSFGEDTIKEFQKQGLKLPPQALKVFYIRDRKIGLKRLTDLTVRLESEKNPERALQILKEADAQKNPRWAPLTSMLRRPLAPMAADWQKAPSLESSLIASLTEADQAAAGPGPDGLKIPLSVFEFYTNAEILALNPAETIELVLSAQDLAAYQTQLAQPLFQSDVYDAYRVGETARGILLHNVPPAGFYERAGLRVGDIVVGLDGVPADSLNYGEALAKLSANKALAFHVVRSNKPVLIRVKVQ